MLAFVLTDVESSTRLWEQEPADMRLALLRHDQLIEEHVARHGGVLVRPRGEGDSRFAVFRSALAATLAAADIQRTLRREPWPTSEPIRIRIAIHTGEADLRDGDYYGAAPNRCARLRELASGGQVLVSATTAALVAGELPDEISLHSLGHHRLKGLSGQEHVFQLVHPDLDSEFPPIRSTGAGATNVPVQLTSLVGRENELSAIRQLLDRERLVSLTGVGGSGKTRLALAVATHLENQFADGIWLVELASLSDGGLIANAIAQAAGIQERPGRSIREAIVETFNSRSVLLILDNCEHLADACADVVSDLLRACSHLHILATSRQSLHAYGEVVYRVPTLAVPVFPRRPASGSSPASLVVDLSNFASVQLFLRRAMAVQPAFALTPENGDAIASICARLDGLPLAIELAAAWAPVLTAAQILKRLDDIFGLLVGGSRGAPTRQQTLHATLEWSFRQLGGHERQQFMSLAVFAGGFDLDAVDAVTLIGGDTNVNSLHVLNGLVDKSLVQASHVADVVRFRLLEPVRQFAGKHLVENCDADAARGRHALYFLSLAERAAPLLLGPGGPAWFDRLNLELDNFRAALDHFVATGDAESGQRLAGKLWPFWLQRGYWTEGSQFLTRVLSMPGGEAPTIGRANSLLGLSHLTEFKGERIAARALFLDASRLQRKLGDDVGLARSLVRLGALATRDSDRTFAREALQEALSLTRATGQRATRVSALLGLARVSFTEGDIQKAQELVEQALGLARDIEWTAGIANSLRNLGEIRGRRGDRTGARQAFEESLAGSRALDDSAGASATLMFLGSLAAAEAEYARAHACLAEAVALRRELGDREGITWSLLAFAGLRAAEGQPNVALRLASAGMAFRDQLGLPLLPASEETGHGFFTVESWLVPARQVLSEREAEDERNSGQLLTVDEAITLALNSNPVRDFTRSIGTHLSPDDPPPPVPQ
jgi:predicted ATPase/class 3 adenylate cyclase